MLVGMTGNSDDNFRNNPDLLFIICSAVRVADSNRTVTALRNNRRNDLQWASQVAHSYLDGSEGAAFHAIFQEKAGDPAEA